jgi:hypothetical protein
MTVIDCSGDEAIKMLADKTDADGVALAIDVSAPKKQITDDFQQAARWLKALHEDRGRRADVADLPVYVVLTKCDQLAKKEDTLDAWNKRLDEVKQKYRDEFNKVLDEQSSGFGTLDLNVVTPVFGDKPLKMKEPLGVAQLFRDCAEDAADYQERRRRAQGRLQNVIAGLLGSILLLGLGVLFLMEYQPPGKATALEERVQLILPKAEATAAQRLQGTPPRLEERLKGLTEIENHEDFARLPREDREAVTSYRQEIAAYLERYNEAQTVLKLPHLAKNQQEFDSQERALKAYHLTDEQAREWAETRLGRRIEQVRKEYRALHQALNEEEAWIRRETEKTARLLKEGTSLYGKLLNNEKGAQEAAVDWMRRFNELQPKPHQPREDNVPGVTRVIWEDLSKFDQVKSAHRDWQFAKAELTGIARLIEKKLKAA